MRSRVNAHPVVRQILIIGSTLALLLGMSSTAFAAAPAVVSAEDTPQAQGSGPATATLSPQWDYFSAAWLSPHVDPSVTKGRVNAAETTRTLQIDITKPPAGTTTKLRLFGGGQLGQSKGVALTDVDSTQKKDAPGLRLSELNDVLCVKGSVQTVPVIDTGEFAAAQNFSEFSCDLDPAKWPTGNGVPASSTEAISTTGKGGGQSTQPLAGTAKGDPDYKVTIAVGLTPVGNTGAERAKNLDTWLAGLSKDLPADSTAAKIEIPDAVEITTGTAGEAAKFGLSWNQCFLPASQGAKYRASCRPDTRSNFWMQDVRPTKTNTAGVPQGTTSDLAYGTLNPGTRWSGGVTFRNNSSMPGWLGPSAFADPKGKTGKVSPYVFTGVIPPNVTSASVGVSGAAEYSYGDCRYPDGKPLELRADLSSATKEQLARASVVCPVIQNGANTRLVGAFGSAAKGRVTTDTVKSWKYGEVGVTRGQADYRISYDVPLRLLETVANGAPGWEKKQRTLDVDVVQPNGSVKRESRVFTNYVTTSMPSVWGWIPASCLSQMVRPCVRPVPVQIRQRPELVGSNWFSSRTPRSTRTP